MFDLGRGVPRDSAPPSDRPCGSGDDYPDHPRGADEPAAEAGDDRPSLLEDLLFHGIVIVIGSLIALGFILFMDSRRPTHTHVIEWTEELGR